MKSRKLYHDTVLMEAIACTLEWTEIRLDERFKVERDRQMLGIKFRDRFIIDIDGNGGIVNDLGQNIEAEIYLVDSGGVKYPLLFTGARGNHIALYRPEVPLRPQNAYEKLRIRCEPSIEAESIIWTTYDLRDLH